MLTFAGELFESLMLDLESDLDVERSKHLLFLLHCASRELLRMFSLESHEDYWPLVLECF